MSADSLGVSVGDGVLVNAGVTVDAGVGVAGVSCGAQATKGRITPSVTSKSHSLRLPSKTTLSLTLLSPVRCYEHNIRDVNVAAVV